jgi:hypothetical protein
MGDRDAKRGTQGKTVGFNNRLAPVNGSDRPVFTNFTRSKGAPRVMFVVDSQDGLVRGHALGIEAKIASIDMNVGVFAVDASSHTYKGPAA